MKFSRMLLLSLMVLLIPFTTFAQEATEEAPAQADTERDAAVEAVALDQALTFYSETLTLSLPEGWTGYEVPSGDTSSVMFGANEASLVYLGELIGMTFDEIIAELDPEATAEPVAEPVQPEVFVVGILTASSRESLGISDDLTFEDLAAQIEGNLAAPPSARREFEVEGYRGLLLATPDNGEQFTVPEGSTVYGVTAFVDYGDYLITLVGISAAPLDETITLEAILRSMQFDSEAAAAAGVSAVPEPETPEPAAEIEGVEVFAGLDAGHEVGVVEYEQFPPAGGPHNAVWQNCGVYTSPIVNEHAVHSLEHGAVWITYQPDLDPAQVEQLAEITRASTHRLLSPFPGIDSPIILSAWGVQLRVESVDDPRVMEFIIEYEQGPTTPEPGAPCVGGQTLTAEELEQ